MATSLNMDLWPKAKFDSDIVTPALILKSQAALLGQKTQQLVTAEVLSDAGGGYVHHYFRLVVPALDNYKYELFRVSHRVDALYPVKTEAYEDLVDQEAFIKWLKGTLASETTLKKIDALVAQAKG